MEAKKLSPEEVIDLMGGHQSLMKILNAGSQRVSNWKRRGGIPEAQALKLQIITKGKIKAENVQRPKLTSVTSHK